MKIAYVTDTGIGEAMNTFAEKDIFMIPLQISDDTVNLQDMEDITKEDLIEKLHENKVMRTSLPSLGRIEECFQNIKDEGYDAIVAVPICSGLSGTIQAMKMTADQMNLPITMIDTHVTAIVQRYLLEKIREWINAGQSQDVIDAKVKAVIDSCNTLLIPVDLNHLKRGGRLTPLAAALGGLLKIKPVLEINQSTQGKIDVKEKVRTFKKAMERAFEIMKADGVDETYSVTFAHVDDEETAKQYAQKAKEEFPGIEPFVWKLCNVVAVHTGLGCQAIQYFKRID